MRDLTENPELEAVLQFCSSAENMTLASICLARKLRHWRRALLASVFILAFADMLETVRSC